ncbi:hypothetical protein BC831DRAFT_552102 [Entophlyctis helioformis]|nr:hypothetical protein BC831DRAFT_552102 [Entophlyctis helioformis]
MSNLSPDPASLQSFQSRFTHNPLLVKHAVGKTRPTVYDLPGKDHVYGKRVERNPLENAATVVQHWNVRATSKHAVPALDYITMNRNSAKHGIISPTQIRNYRETHPVRVKIGDHALFGSKPTGMEGGLQRTRGPLPSDTNTNFAYGKPTRPSTPVARLMTDKFQREWIDQHEHRAHEKTRHEDDKTAKKLPSRIAPLQHSPPKPKSALDKDPKTLFKMSKFLKVPPKVVSHRPDGDPAMPWVRSNGIPIVRPKDVTTPPSVTFT